MWALAAVASLVAVLIAAPFVLFVRTNASLASDPEVLEGWAWPASPDGLCDPGPEEDRDLVGGALERCAHARMLGRDACPDLRPEVSARIEGLDRCSPRARGGETMGHTPERDLELRMWVRAAEGGRACVDAALDHYLVLARIPYETDMAALDQAAATILRCGARLPEEERRAVGDALWSAANELQPPHRLLARLLSARPAPRPLELGEENALDRFLEARRWAAEADGLLGQGPIPAMTPGDPLRSFDPGERVHVTHQWLRTQAELRAIALFVSGDSRLPAERAADLEARGLALRRLAHGCVAFASTAFPDEPRSASYCRGTSPAVAAVEWLDRASLAVRARRAQSGEWPAPIGASRLAVGDGAARYDPAWAELDVSPPRHPEVVVALRTPDPSLTALADNDRILHAAFVGADRMHVHEIAFGMQQEGEDAPEPRTVPVRAHVAYCLGDSEAGRAGFCEAPCE